ncbi:MAG: hypothetical protein C0471_14250, partial [Erythrobacter sp.]|nr:hypothetical protein [Erythrobacter sp.]
MNHRFLTASLSALALALASTATPVLAQSSNAASAAPQATADLPSLVSQVQIPYQRFQLDNGLTVIVHEDRKAPIVGV